MNGWKFDKKVSVSTALSYFFLSCCGPYFKSFILKAVRRQINMDFLRPD